MNKYSTAYAEHQQETKQAADDKATAEFLNITLDEYKAMSRHDRLVATAARKGINVTFNADTGAKATSWSLANKLGRSAQITKGKPGGYNLECDGFEAVEAQHERDAYRKFHGIITAALGCAIHLLS